MLRIRLFAIVICFHFCASAQVMDLRDITSLLDGAGMKRIDAALQKKGFHNAFLSDTDGYIQSYCWSSRTTKGFAENSGIYIHLEKENSVVYQLNSSEEHKRIVNEIEKAGFTGIPGTDSTSILFQQENTRIECWQKKQDTSFCYLMRFSRKALPKRKNIMMAEDLLQLDAEQYVSEVFGKENIRSDYFYFTEKDSSRATVIFPGTAMEAIYVWQDEMYRKNIAFIMIGGCLKGKLNNKLSQPIGQNMWSSRQGVYCGMSMREVQMRNQENLKLWNWQTESAGHVLPNKTGLIDFTRLGIMFNCLNCDYIKESDTPLTDSEKVLNASQRAYVSEMIILPERKPAQTL